MFDRFSVGARDAMARSRDEACRLGHDFIAPAHVFLALVADEGDVPARALLNLGLDPAAVSAAVVGSVPRRTALDIRGQLPFTPGSTEMLEKALEEAERRADEHIGTEHLFLGVLRADDTAFLGQFVARAFDECGLKPFAVRDEVVRLIAGR